MNTPAGTTMPFPPSDLAGETLRHEQVDASKQSFWAPYAWLDAENAPTSNVRIIVAHGFITGIARGVPADPQDIQLQGLLMPGAANCHAHTFHRALRGLGHEGSTFWQWRDTMYRIAHSLTPELYYQYARAVYAEMVLAGYTSVAEFHYVHHQINGKPYSDPNAFGKALIHAALDAGIRLTLLDTCYLHAGVDASPLGDHQLRFGDASAEAWKDRVQMLDDEVRARDLPTIQIGAAAHSVRALQPEEAAIVVQWARSGNSGSDDNSHNSPRPLHVHLSEQTAENQVCLDHTGLTPTQLLDKVGFWGPYTTAVHATHMTDNDIAILREHGVTVAICPTTEADLADGVGPARTYRDHQIHLCIGSDECVCIDPFEEIRQLDAHERLVCGQRDTFSPTQLVHMLTLNGQLACGWTTSGSLEVGKSADFITVNTCSPRTAGSSLDSIPLTASSADVLDVVVNGKRIVSNGRHCSIDDVPQQIAMITEQLRQ